MNPEPIARRVLGWHRRHGRHDLPWQHDRTPYRVWLSEIMLQQTQAATVIPYFQRFTARFPGIAELAAADLDEVLHLWTGLGYYARARNLHKAAGLAMEKHGGELPDDQDALEALPGIGRSTAAAIRALAYGAHATILDGNVKRVLARHFTVSGHTGSSATLKELWQLAEKNTPTTQTDTYTQGIMDLGATVCTPRNPSCETCPLSTTCQALAADAVKEYPERKQRRKKPERHCEMYLILTPDGSCLLEQQPPSGLWGGLFSPPMRPEGTGAANFAQELWGTQMQLESEALDRFRHTFTHFHLHISPIRVELAAIPGKLLDGERYLWRQPGDNRPIGLSVPAVKLLREMNFDTP